MQFVSKRLFWVAATVVLTACLVFFYWRSWERAALHRLLPAGTALALEWNGLDALDSLSRAAPETGLDVLTEFPFWRTLRADLSQAADLATADSSLLAALQTHTIVFGASLAPADSLHGFFALRLAGPFELDEFVRKMGADFRETRLKSTGIFTIMTNGTPALTLAHHDGVLVFSRHAYLVEDVLKEQTRFWKKNVLPAAADADRAARLRLWVRPAALAGMFSVSDVNGDAWNQYLPWLIVQWRDTGVVFQAPTPGGGAGFLKSLLDDQKAGIPAGILPASVAAIAVAAWDDPGLLAWNADAGDRQAFETYIQPWLGKTIGAGFAAPEAGQAASNRFILLEAADARQAEASLRAYGAAYGFVRPPLPHQTFEVFEFLQSSAIRPLAGGGAAFERPVAAVVDGYVVLAARRDLLERWIDHYVVGQTLSNDPFYLQLERQMPGNAGALLYLNGAWLEQQLGRWLPEVSFSRIRLAVVPTAWERRRVEGRLIFQPAAAAQQPAALAWKTTLRAPVVAGPFSALHPDGDKPALMVQDAQNLLYCLDEQGQIVWTRQLDGRIAGAVHTQAARARQPQVYWLNTAGKIYRLDARGRDTDGFPLPLQTAATNGITLADIRHDGRPVLFVACANGNLYGFDDYGRPLPGWNPCVGMGRVIHPVQYIAYRASDCIAVLNEAGELRLLGQDGSLQAGPIRLPEPVDFPMQTDTARGEPAIVLFGSSGSIYAVGIDGKLTVPVMGRPGIRQRGGVVTARNFVALRGSHLGIFRNSGAFEKDIRFSVAPDTLFAAGPSGVGLLSRAEKRIWSYGPDGRLASGFPLAGSSVFIRAASDTSMIFTGFEREVYAYRLPG